MSQKLKPYPEYKDSGLPWTGKIPAHWVQKSIQTITWKQTRLNHPTRKFRGLIVDLK